MSAKRFQFDLTRCPGCHACMLACTIQNRLEPGTSWRHVATVNPARLPDQPLYHLSLACNHCEDPACMRHCPALAYRRDEATGAVTIDPEACVGCRYCAWACPYDAPRFDTKSGVMTKCTFCDERLAEGEEPACAAACPTDALRCADRDDPSGVDGVPGFPQAKLEPGIRFMPLREERRIPEKSEQAAPEAVQALFDPDDHIPPSRITLRGEWPLVVFSLTAAGLFAAVAASHIGDVKVPFPVFLIAGLGGLGLSALHLGRKERAHRAILNLRQSWLSREIVFFTLFLALATARLLTGDTIPGLGAAAAGIGLVALVAIDRVYGAVVHTGKIAGHSAGVLLTGLFWTGLFLGDPLIISFVGLIKLVRYTQRKFRAQEEGRPVRLLITSLRLGIGIALPTALWFLDPIANSTIALICFALGDLLDRCEFYLELEIQSPRRECARTTSPPSDQAA